MSSDFRVKYKKLLNEPENSKPNWYQKRGFEFETIINHLLEEEGLLPRTSYKMLGEQIDGSFIFEGKIYLLEAKWHNKEMCASDIYEFKGKIDGKLVGTIGIFISISGYSKDSVDALTLGKSLNIILFNQEDFESCIQSEIGFKKVLVSKLRIAAEEGIVFYPYNKFFITKDAPSTGVINYAFNHLDKSILKVDTDSGIDGDIIIICEGNRDQAILSMLSKRIMEENSIKKQISIIVAMGKITVPKVASSIYNRISRKQKIVMVVDSDNDKAKTLQMFEKLLDFDGGEFVIPEPYIEIWFSKDIQNMKKNNKMPKYEEYLQLIYKEIQTLDMLVLKQTNESFDKFYNIISLKK